MSQVVLTTPGFREEYAVDEAGTRCVLATVDAPDWTTRLLALQSTNFGSSPGVCISWIPYQREAWVLLESKPFRDARLVEKML
jgi:hypothetical protein